MITLAALFALATPLIFAEAPQTGEAKSGDQTNQEILALQTKIEQVRGLKFKEPVKVERISRPSGEDPGKQGYYDAATKRLVLFTDVKGSYQKGVLIHELVHALQDQHFNLQKLGAALHKVDENNDDALALSALIEGDASLTMVEVLKEEQPAAGKMFEGKLETARNLKNSFLYGQGGRYVQSLKAKGGWKTVDFAYFNPPTTTRAILDPATRKGSISLGSGKVRGAYGLMETLLSQPQTREKAVALAKQWRGDRVEEKSCCTAWTVMMDSPEAAANLATALSDWATAQHPEWKKSDTKGMVAFWTVPKKGSAGIVRHGQTVLLYEDFKATDPSGWKNRLTSPPRMTLISGADTKPITTGQFLDKLLAADFVCLGEKHDSLPEHRAQLWVLDLLHAADPSLGLGMEAFHRPFQKPLDDHSESAIDEPAMLSQTEYATRWGYAWELDAPLLRYCRQHRMPVAGLNLPREITRKLSADGFDKFSDKEKQELGPMDFQVPEHRTHWFEKLAAMHGNGTASPERKEKSYQVMAAWDHGMASSAANFKKERGLNRMVLIAGSGHIERRFGIPDRVAKLSGGKSVAIRVIQAGEPLEEKGKPLADLAIVLE